MGKERITERSLKDACMLENNGVFKNWSFGLKVERYGDGFMLYLLYREPGHKPKESPLFLSPRAAKETMCFIEGFSKAAALANSGEGK